MRERSNLSSGGWRERAEGAEQLLQGWDPQGNRTCHETEGGDLGVGTWPEHSKGAAMTEGVLVTFLDVFFLEKHLRPPPWKFSKITVYL